MSFNNILKNLPEKSGIYKMLDNKKSVIYVGKASNLKKRVSSYFTKSYQSIKTNRLVDNIKSIETIITKNEEEALILENNLIKKFKYPLNKIAIEKNNLIVEKKKINKIILKSNDKIEIVHFIGGG